MNYQELKELQKRRLDKLSDILYYGVIIFGFALISIYIGIGIIYCFSSFISSIY